NEGCQSFEHALFTLYKQGMISVEQAIANSDGANNLRLKIKLDGSGGDAELYKLSGRDQKGNNELRIKSERSPLPNAFRKLCRAMLVWCKCVLLNPDLACNCGKERLA